MIFLFKGSENFMKSLISSLIAFLFIFPLQAITILHTVDEQSYLDLAAPYNAVGRILIPGRAGSGTLISHNQILTAAHVVTDSNDRTLVTAAGSINFLMGTNVSNPSYSLSIASVSVHPLWASSGDNGYIYDLAVLTLTTSFFDVTPIGLSDVDPSGMVGTMVGYGMNGTGLPSSTLILDGYRRAAQNMIDFDSPAIYTDFDAPSPYSTNVFGNSVPLALEGSVFSGDSGGPMLVEVAGQMQIVGVQHAVANLYGAPGKYSNISISSGFTNPDNLAFLVSNGISIPEPSSVFLLFAGFFGLLLVRKRRCS